MWDIQIATKSKARASGCKRCRSIPIYLDLRVTRGAQREQFGKEICVRGEEWLNFALHSLLKRLHVHMIACGCLDGIVVEVYLIALSDASEEGQTAFLPLHPDEHGRRLWLKSAVARVIIRGRAITRSRTIILKRIGRVQPGRLLLRKDSQIETDPKRKLGIPSDVPIQRLRKYDLGT
jgi:hypothetical protein